MRYRKEKERQSKKRKWINLATCTEKSELRKVQQKVLQMWHKKEPTSYIKGKTCSKSLVKKLEQDAIRKERTDRQTESSVHLVCGLASSGFSCCTTNKLQSLKSMWGRCVCVHGEEDTVCVSASDCVSFTVQQALTGQTGFEVAHTHTQIVSCWGTSHSYCTTLGEQTSYVCELFLRHWVKLSWGSETPMTNRNHAFQAMLGTVIFTVHVSFCVCVWYLFSNNLNLALVLVAIRSWFNSWTF